MITGRVPLLLRQQCQRSLVHMDRKQETSPPCDPVCYGLCPERSARTVVLALVTAFRLIQSPASRWLLPSRSLKCCRSLTETKGEFPPKRILQPMVEHTIVDEPMPWILAGSGKVHRPSPGAHLRGGDPTQFGKTPQDVSTWASGSQPTTIVELFVDARRCENSRAHPDSQQSITQRTSNRSSMIQCTSGYRICQ